MPQRLFTLLCFFSIVLTSNLVAATKFQSASKQAILMDAQTGKILFEKNAHTPMYPSSMTKIMTAFMVFDQLQQGRLSLDDTWPVSTTAWRKGGARMFLNVGSQARVEDLIRGIVVQSGNDASIVVAEALSGDEETFAAAMNQRAKELGAQHTHFRNATGWPDPKHLTTTYDLAIISLQLIKMFPDYYDQYFKETEFTYNKIRQMNRNPLLYRNIGADGLKTGQTEAGGLGLVASAVRDGRRLILVVNGLKTKGERARESEALMTWGFRNFLTPKICSASEPITRANVWLGTRPDVALYTESDVYVTVPTQQAQDLKVELQYSEPLPAPLAQGDMVGKLIVTCPDGEIKETALRVEYSVAKAGFFERIRAAVYYLFWGHNQK